MPLHSLELGKSVTNAISETVPLQIQRSKDGPHSRFSEFLGFEQRENQEFYELASSVWDSDPLRRSGISFDNLLLHAKATREYIGGVGTIPSRGAARVVLEDIIEKLRFADLMSHLPREEVKDLFSFSYTIPVIIQPLFAKDERLIGPTNTIYPARYGNFFDYESGETITFHGLDPSREIELFDREVLEKLFSDPLSLSPFVDYLQYGMSYVTTHTKTLAGQYTLRELHQMTSENYKEILKRNVHAAIEARVANEALLAIGKNSADGFGYENTTAKTYIQFGDLVKDGDTILEIGSGLGITTWLFADASRNQTGVTIIGFDVGNTTILPGSVWGEEALDQARHFEYVSLFNSLYDEVRSGNLSPPYFVRGSLAHLDATTGKYVSTLAFPQQSFDIIVIGQMLRYLLVEYGEDTTEIIESMLKPGGYAIVAEADKTFVFQKRK